MVKGGKLTCSNRKSGTKLSTAATASIRMILKIHTEHLLCN